MSTNGNTDNLLTTLNAALVDSGLEDESRRVQQLYGKPVLEVMDGLSLLERIVNDSQVHKAIALCKQAITGKIEPEPFTEQCRRLQGMI